VEIELWWLLALPIFFGLGWLAARIDLQHLLRESRALPGSYFRGLNFLLNEQPDKAIEAFLEAARVDAETLELHFALGSLFRRRGEHDRAIRIHQNLVERAGLSAAERLHALAELGEDYLKAGLFDRAEDIFLRLRGSERDGEARTALLEIYQAEKEWHKAIAIVAAMPAQPDHHEQRLLAQFHCELAAGALLHGRHEEARRELEQALAANRKCVRAALLLGDLALAAGFPDEAIEAWTRIERMDADSLALVAERLLAAFRQSGHKEQGRQLLVGYLERHPALDLLDAAFQIEQEVRGVEAAHALVRDELRRNPTLLGLDKLLEAQCLLAAPERRGDLELVRNLIHQHTRRVARFRCRQCGFKARQYHWRCPACGGWETYPPRRSEEFDLAP